MQKKRTITFGMFALFGLIWCSGCSTAPHEQNQAAFIDRSDSTRTWFESNVSGLDEQIATSAGYIVFPNVAQWGTLFSGGKFGRGALHRPDGSLIGWGSVNTGSFGLQLGAQVFCMLIVIEDLETLFSFMSNSWSGSADAVAVAGEATAQAISPFRSGTAMYTGDNKGLMAGASLGFNFIRYQPLMNESIALAETD